MKSVITDQDKITERDEKGKYQKGVSGNTKGRPVGIKDCRAAFKDLKQILMENNFDPRQAMIELASHPKSSIRIQATKYLLERISPTLKSIEMTGKLTVETDIEEIKRFKEMCELEKKDV